jgi:hypothetical protein
MIDRAKMVRDMATALWGEEADAQSMAEKAFDQVVLPALTEYLDEPVQRQVIAVVDNATQRWQAANARQVAIINRLQAQIASLKEELNRNRTTVGHLEEAVLDPGD